jgi:hypothetical protein
VTGEPVNVSEWEILYISGTTSSPSNSAHNPTIPNPSLSNWFLPPIRCCHHGPYRSSSATVGSAVPRAVPPTGPAPRHHAPRGFTGHRSHRVASTRLADVPPCVAAPYGLAGHHRAAGHQAWRIRSDEKIIVDILKKMLVQNLDRNIFFKKC